MGLGVLFIFLLGEERGKIDKKKPKDKLKTIFSGNSNFAKNAFQETIFRKLTGRDLRELFHGIILCAIVWLKIRSANFGRDVSYKILTNIFYRKFGRRIFTENYF